MASKVQLWNMALARVGVTQFIGNETEKSHEANVMRTFYEPTLDFALRDYDWNFSRRQVALALLAGAVPLKWLYKYSYPSSCVAVRAIVPPGVSWPRKEQRIPYEIANEETTSGDRVVIYTNLPNAELIFSHRVTDTSLFDPHFVSAFAYLLGSEAAIPLSMKAEVAKQARDAYVMISSRAAASNLNEQEEGPEPEPEVIAYRNA